MDGSSDEVSLKMYALPGTASEGEVGDNARNRQQLQQPQPKVIFLLPSLFRTNAIKAVSLFC